jgi:hypothetical protein
MILTEWAKRHNIPPHMIAELRLMLLGSDMTPDTPAAPGSEAAVQNAIRLASSRVGGRLWRNNLGAGKLENGSYVRWGLCNDSPAINAHVKSGDLIGVYPLLITPEHVGQTVGQFWSIECKRAGWKYRGDSHEVAQLRWIEQIVALGGRASFSTGAL